MGATKKPAAPKRAAADAPSDAELLAQQAEEEAAEKRALSEEEAAAAARDDAAMNADDRAESDRVRELPDQADGEHNGSLIDAVLETQRGTRLEMLERLYVARHGAGAGVPEDDALLAMEEELISPAPAPPPAAPTDLGLGDLPPAVLAIIAAQQQTTAALIEKLGEVVSNQAAAQQASVGLTGSVTDLISQLDGTVSDGGDGDDPLDEPVTFIAKGKNLLVVKKSRHRQVMPDGSQAFTQGIAADFAPTGSFTTRNREMVDYLRKRPGMNVEYWELGKEPHSAPNPKLIMDKIIEATLAMDDDALAELEQQEQASHKRPVVLGALATARNRIQGVTGAAAE